MTEPKETTMATIQSTRDNPIEGRLASTPKTKDKKAPRSILKGKNQDKNEDEKEKIEEKYEQYDDSSTSPDGRRGKVADDEKIRNDLSFTFENMINDEESMAKNNKN
jgi:hypothetical protein